MDKTALLTMTKDIVAAHASMNELTQEELLAEIQNIYTKLAALGGVEDVESVLIEGMEGVATPAVPLQAAFGAEKVFCMVCGKGMKTLKRHLATSHDLKPGQYRKQFDIPAGTPLVAKNYSEARKKMAKDLNLAAGLAKARAARKKKK
jgi:predicted transcriptional regulator